MLVARALSLMLTKQNCVGVLKELYDRMSLSDQNTLHGVLCVVIRTLQDREKLVSFSTLQDREKLLSTPQDREKLVSCNLEGARSISVLILQLHLQKWSIGSRYVCILRVSYIVASSSCSDNRCAITRALYLEILSSLLRRDDIQSTVLSSLDDTSLSQLHTLFAVSREVCTDASSGLGTADSTLLVEHVRLLTLAARYSSEAAVPAVTSLRGPEGAEVLVGVLRHCRDPKVCACVLEGVRSLREGRSHNSLRGGEGWGLIEESLRTIMFQYVMEQSDPDLLIQVTTATASQQIVPNISVSCRL